MNMDVNLRRLADKIILILKFLVRLTIFMQHPHSTDGAVILVKASGKTVYHQGKHTPKNCWYFKETKTNALHTQKLFLLTLSLPSLMTPYTSIA